MGRKAGVMRVNPKTLTRKTLPCFQEMLIFLSCIQKFNYDDDKCAAEKRALNMCMELQAKQPKQSSTINYHLQRISRMMKATKWWSCLFLQVDLNSDTFQVEFVVQSLSYRLEGGILSLVAYLRWIVLLLSCRHLSCWNEMKKEGHHASFLGKLWPPFTVCRLM